MLLIYTFYFKSEYSAYFWFRSFKKSLLIAIAVSTSPMTIPFALVSIVIIVFILAHTTGCHRRRLGYTQLILIIDDLDLLS